MVEVLEAELAVRIDKLAKGLAAAEARVNAAARKIDSSTSKVNRKMTQNLAQSAQGWAKLGQVTGAQRFVLQNTANQIGDIAVQLSSGTNALRVMGQQIPQVLGGFGALGGSLGLIAPLLGTIAAIGLPIAAVFLSQADATEKAKEKADDFAASLRKAESALHDAEQAAIDAGAGGLEDLQKRFGAITDDVVTLIDKLADLKLETAKATANEALKSIIPGSQETIIGKSSAENLKAAATQYEDVVAKLENVRRQLFSPASLTPDQFTTLDQQRVSLERQLALLRPIRDGFADIGDQLNLLPGEVDGLLARLAEVRIQTSKGNFRGAADALAEAREYAESIGLTVRDQVLQNIIQAEATTRELANQMDQAAGSAGGVADSAGDITPPVAAAADEAARLAGNLAAALSLLDSLDAGIAKASRLAAQRNAVLSSTVGDAPARAAGLARVDFNENTGKAAFDLIRSGQTGELSRLAEIGSQTEALAAEEAQAEATIAALDKLAKGGGGGKNAGEKEFNELLKERQRVLESLKSPADKYAEALATIKQLETTIDPSTGKFLITAEQADAARKKLEELKPVAQDVRNALQSAFQGVFDDPKKALEDLGKKLLEIVLQMQLAKLLPNVFGSDGIIPLTKNAKGGVYSGPGISSYSGKVVSSPTVFPFAKGVGLMGEAGPEGILPLARVNGKLGVRSTGGGTTVQVIDQRGAGSPPVREERGTGPDGREMVRIIVGEEIGKGSFDRPMKGRYGAQTQRVKI